MKKKWYALFFIPISANIDHGNHSLLWAPHRLHPLDFNFYDHVRTHFSCCSFYKNNHEICNIKFRNNIHKGEVVEMQLKKYISLL